MTSATTVNTTNGGSAVNSSVANAFLWRDGALIQTVTHDADTGSGSNPIWTTNYTYNRRNDLTLADINDGRPRDVVYVTDLKGQIIRSDEADGLIGEAALAEGPTLDIPTGRKSFLRR